MTDFAMTGIVDRGHDVGLNVGDVFAGYTIVRFLGSGGMGEVYLAEHPRLPRREALKVLGNAVSADDDYRRRFIREADLAAALWHPNIVRVNDRGEFNGQLWISMDFVDGTDAASLLRNHYPVGMPAGAVATIIAAIASALDYAHQHHDLLHRDVGPANILLSQPEEGDQRILLGDFGIARNIFDASGLTATNMTIGTFPYAAPEQLTDEPMDGRADQYALAATAYHLLTGSTLFPHSNPAVVIGRHLTTPPPPLAETRPKLRVFDPVLAVALAKDPADRFPRCIDFADEFARAARSGRHPTASASTMPRPLAIRPDKPTVAPTVLTDNDKQRQHKPWRIFAAASTVIALAAAGASGYPIDNDAAPAEQPAAPPTLAQPAPALPEPPPAAPPPASTPSAPKVEPAAQNAPPPVPSTPRRAQATPAPVQPAPQQLTPDQTFLNLVSEIPGVTITDPATAAATGRAVCVGIQNGASPNDAAAATVNGNQGISPEQATAGINAAITAYCPQLR